MQFWSEKNPCTYCGATSNTSHPPRCRNYMLYTQGGAAIEAMPADPNPSCLQCGEHLGKPFHKTQEHDEAAKLLREKQARMFEAARRTNA